MTHDRSQTMKRPASILIATYQGYPGDNDTPFIPPVLTRLVERGHAIRFILGPGVRQTRLPASDKVIRRLTDLGVTSVPFRAPESHPFDRPPPVKGLIGRWIPGQ